MTYAKDNSVSFMKLLSNFRYETLVAGVSGGAISTIVVHPLDVIKIRFQASDGIIKSHKLYEGLRNATVTIAKEEGIRGFYKGVTPNVWGAGSSWGLYFFFYGGLKTWMQVGDSSIHLGASRHIMAATLSGIATLSITNPVWVVKTRLVLQYGESNKQYKGVFDTLIKLYHEHGIRGWYKGFVPGLWGVSHGALQFMAYEELKALYCSYKNQPVDKKLGSLEYLSFAALSKLFAAAVTYPFQLVRTRLQDQHRKTNGVFDVVTRTWKNEGVNGFYKGLVPNLLRVVPATAVTFVVYENLSRLLMAKQLF